MQAALEVSRQPLSKQMPQCQTRSPFLIPIFQKIPYVPPLHKMSPMLERSISHRLDIDPERNVHYHPLPTLAIPEGRVYGLRGSSSRAETPVAMQAALVVSRQPLSNQMPQHQSRSPFLIPIFQEIPYVPPLHKIPPMLERSASYPLDIDPERNVHYHSLPTLALE
ncbi:Testis-expressed sequence 38 protein [Sciurus carolinensis]|uniref:Testis-expressed sequence 38 protein n=1 Tax=Sciurus carolinensis TaxID=30640 RepID=A0AA41MSE8_SCICA|nr:Testis-expressed sequence 38 protein [Sciurus carolinensis]